LGAEAGKGFGYASRGVGAVRDDVCLTGRRAKKKKTQTQKQKKNGAGPGDPPTRHYVCVVRGGGESGRGGEGKVLVETVSNFLSRGKFVSL